ncbi:MAG: yuxK [Pseudobdellovibrio sp.]|jgi:predicted DCC family thiol-disulfide oxidoreductase YuxK|nr:yuxK [Pseudobdellovibrio sp.]
MQRIIFFDGVCNLCDSVVSRVFKIDKKHKFLFASLQSEAAQRLLKKQDFEKDSIVYFEDGHCYYEADAVLKILQDLGGGYRFFAGVLRIFPRSFRDWIYRKVAKNRYQLFGKKSQCRMASANEKAYFLD